MSRNQELLFAQTLEKVRNTAKEQGNCVSKEQVKEAFAELELNQEQLQMVFDYLVKHKVGIGEPVNLDEFLTEEDRNYLQDYLNEIEALPSYSSGEKEALTISSMAGDVASQKKLIQAYLKEVVDVARLYAGQGVLLEDLIGEGNVALAIGVTMLGSLEKPSEAQGMLAKMMMDSMEEYIQENAENEKTELQVAAKVNKVADKARELAEEFHRKVTPGELAEDSGMSLKSILEAVRMSGYRIEDIEYAKDDLSGL